MVKPLDLKGVVSISQWGWVEPKNWDWLTWTTQWKGCYARRGALSKLVIQNYIWMLSERFLDFSQVRYDSL